MQAKPFHILVTPWGLAGLLVLLLFIALAPQHASAQDAGRAIQVDPGWRIGLVPEPSGVEDGGFSQLAHEGVLRAVDQLGVIANVYTPTDAGDIETQLQNCVNAGNDLCLGVGFLASDPILAVANANPGTKFALVDGIPDSPPANLRGLIFAEREAGYLAGTLAGLMTSSDRVGVIGGMQVVPAVVEFVEGYRNGAQCANDRVDVLLEYTENFMDPELGASTAQAMLAQGADVIFAPAGGTGIGAVLTTTQSGAWGIGVDIDYYLGVYENGAVEGSDWLLSSAMKNLDTGVFLTIQDVLSATFTSGAVLYDLESGGVGLAPYHEADGAVSQSVRDALAQVEAGITGGSVDLSEDCRFYLMTPLVVR